MSSFASWLDTFIDEKGLDLEHRFDVEGSQWGNNSIPLGCVVDVAKRCSSEEQAHIKRTLVQLGFHNSDVLSFFEHLAKGMAL